jgi:hypothetical protein
MTLIVALMTLIAVVPLGSVAGLIVALETGWDKGLCALVGAGVGTLYGLLKAKG